MQAPRGPNALNIMAYTHGEEEDHDYTEEAVSSRPNVDGKAIEDQFDNFVQDMQRYDQILSQVAKNIEEIDGEKESIVDFYPKFIWESTYQEEQEKKIVANTDPELAKIIQNLQRNNRVLKDDMRAWVFEFAKTAKLTQVLIGENKVLRQSIAKKNKEIVKLIESIGEAENQEITELVENLQLLKEENGVLREHLVRLKEEVAEKRKEEERIQNAIKQVQQQFQELEKEKNEAEDEEEHLSKTFELIQQWRNEADKRRRKLQKEKEYLTNRHREYEQQKRKIQNELDLCSKQKQDLESGLKRQFIKQQNQKYKLMEQIHDYGDQIAKHKSEARYFEEETARNLAKKQQYEKIAKDYNKKVADGQQKLKDLKKELELSQTAEINLECQIQMEKYDIEILKNQLNQLQAKEEAALEECKRDMRRKEEARNRQISQWQSKVIQSQRELAMKIMQERSELSTKQNELQRWEQKIYEKKEQLSDLKGQIKEIKENQVRLAELKARLQQKQH